MTKKIGRVGLFGGSFDPVHRAHVAVAREAVRQADLDRLIFLPAARSPLKSHGPEASGEARLEMLRAAVRMESWALVCDWELRQPGPSYSWQTVEHFRKEFGAGTELFWLMGADQWVDLERWRRWEFLAAEVTFLVFSRDGVRPEPRNGVRSLFLEGAFDGSSTRVRRSRAVGSGEWKALLDDDVAEIVVKENLYSPVQSSQDGSGLGHGG